MVNTLELLSKMNFWNKDLFTQLFHFYIMLDVSLELGKHHLRTFLSDNISINNIKIMKAFNISLLIFL